MQKSEKNLFQVFSFSENGSGADPRGRLGMGGRVESESPSRLQWDPVSRKGTHKLGMGPAIDYSNLLGLKLCFPQLNVSSNSAIRSWPLWEEPIPSIADSQLQGGNSGNGTRPINNWGLAIGTRNRAGNFEASIAMDRLQFGNSCNWGLRAPPPCSTN